MDIKRILVVCRIPEFCHEAVLAGLSLSKKYDAELYVMRSIYDPFIRGDWNLPVQLGAMEDEYKKMQTDAMAALEKIVSAEKKKGTAIKEIVREGKPAEEILKTVKEEKIDLIVMLCHEETRLEHWLFGRSTEDIIRKMPCSVLLVRKELPQANF